MLSYKALYKRKCLEVIALKKRIEKLEQECKIKSVKSNTAKAGYCEEELAAADFNSSRIRKMIAEYTGNKLTGIFHRVTGINKTDITNSAGYNIQVKKYKTGQFGQVDRRWVSGLIESIPTLSPIAYLLNGLCESPLLPCGKMIDKTKTRKLLSTDNYSATELTYLIKVLNDNKKNILECIFLGNNPKYSPNILCGIEYIDNKRNNMTLYRMTDVIEYLAKQDFKITKSRSVISLGDCLTIQRKGGDGGKKSANNIQFKLVFSRLKIISGIVILF